MADQSAALSNPTTMGLGWRLPDRGAVGMLMLILTETVLFAMFVVAYAVYMGKSTTGPYPNDILHTPILSTICLLSSSVTIVFAENALKKAQLGQFKVWWFVTIALGAEFLTATAIEWRHLIYNEHFTITTNLFGTTFYSLVGLHASHVLVGLILLLVAMLAAIFGYPMQKQSRRLAYLSWYWHFVDSVWVVVFITVYVIGR